MNTSVLRCRAVRCVSIRVPAKMASWALTVRCPTNWTTPQPDHLDSNCTKLRFEALSIR